MRDYSNRKIDYENRKAKPINYDTLLQIRINKNLKDKIYELAEKNKIPISEIVRNALEKYIKKNDSDSYWSRNVKYISYFSKIIFLIFRPYWSPIMTHPP